MTKLQVLAVISVVDLMSACSAESPASETPFDPVSPAEVECIDLATNAAQAQGDRVFVEAGGAQYAVTAARAVAGDRVIVETSVDQPDLVGYDQVFFLSKCEAGEVILLGGYVPTEGSMQLLFTTNEGSVADDVPLIAP